VTEEFAATGEFFLAPFPFRDVTSGPEDQVFAVGLYPPQPEFGLFRLGQSGFYLQAHLFGLSVEDFVDSFLYFVYLLLCQNLCVGEKGKRASDEVLFRERLPPDPEVDEPEYVVGVGDVERGTPLWRY
jgi:hypothetical protein